MGELPYAPECQKRLETQLCLRMRVHQCVAYENPVLIMLEHHFFLQQHSSDTV